MQMAYVVMAGGSKSRRVYLQDWMFVSNNMECVSQAGNQIEARSSIW